MRRGEYIESDAGRRHQRLVRQRRHLRILVEGIEPRGKKGMPPEDKVSF